MIQVYGDSSSDFTMFYSKLTFVFTGSGRYATVIYFSQRSWQGYFIILEIRVNDIAIFIVSNNLKLNVITAGKIH